MYGLSPQPGQNGAPNGGGMYYPVQVPVMAGGFVGGQMMGYGDRCVSLRLLLVLDLSSLTRRRLFPV